MFCRLVLLLVSAVLHSACAWSDNPGPGATPCEDVEVTPSVATVVRCLIATNSRSQVTNDDLGRVASYEFNVSCDDGRHHTGYVEFNYATSASDATVAKLEVDGKTCPK